MPQSKALQIATFKRLFRSLNPNEDSQAVDFDAHVDQKLRYEENLATLAKTYPTYLWEKEPAWRPEDLLVYSSETQKLVESLKKIEDARETKQRSTLYWIHTFGKRILQFKRQVKYGFETRLTKLIADEVGVHPSEIHAREKFAARWSRFDSFQKYWSSNWSKFSDKSEKLPDWTLVRRKLLYNQKVPSLQEPTERLVLQGLRAIRENSLRILTSKEVLDSLFSPQYDKKPALEKLEIREMNQAEFERDYGSGPFYVFHPKKYRPLPDRWP